MKNIVTGVIANKRLYVLIFTCLSCFTTIKAQDEITILQNQRELFVDDFLIEETQKLDFRLATPVSGGKVMEFHEPWEGHFCAYVTIIPDGRLFHMYYRGLQDQQEVTCYAVSADGIHWSKPQLGLYEVNGTLENNVILPDNPQKSTHNLSIMYDNREGVPQEEKFKAMGGHIRSGGLYRYISADGIHWNRYQDTTGLFGELPLDSHNILSWIPSENQFAVYMRDWIASEPGNVFSGIRTISRATSKDFKNWTEPVRMDFGDTPPEHLYTNATHPYFRAPQILIAMPFRFTPDKQVLSEDELISFDVDPTQRKGVSDAVLMTSRGGNKYDRKYLTSFVRPGKDQRNWAARSNMPAMGVIPTGEREMSFFVIRAYGTPDVYLERMVLRKDGFASLHADFEEGSAISKPLILKGDILKANYSTSTKGYVKVVILDEKGNEVPGYGEADAIPAIGDQIDGTLSWQSGKTLQALGGKKVRIKFIIKDADLYSFGVFDK
ncbi:hypothetical protein OKW21_004188 [Catalinimonas alkaloidigena]|uniref:hypothetical protein n=1 Tax=Catalinimonas alkaloidigena TaxID=1075417 RepID=UPI002405D9E0|nr:hypothetical protein [Catalinimonas alkaloidigena]MDF9798925.1 hypothetical protein [Catalinimonas alkaloidigena]